MNDVLGVQVVHALRRLPRNIYQHQHVELGLRDVDVLVEAGALAPLRDDRQVRLRRTAHEQQDVHMSRFPEINNKEYSENIELMII